VQSPQLSSADSTTPEGGALAERGDARKNALRRVFRGVAVVLLPLVTTALALRALIPPAGHGVAGEVAAVGRRYPFLFGAALFLLFSAVSRYWFGRFFGASPASSPPRTPGSRLVPLLASIGLAAGAALVFRVVARPFRVEGASMLPRLEPGDLVAGRAWPPVTPRRGDVVVFRLPRRLPSTGASAAGADVDLLKRIVGLPGDRIEMQGSQPVINGWPVPSCDAGPYLYITRDGEQAVRGRVRVEFLDDRAYLTVFSITKPFFETYTIKPGEAFVLGDDRGNSLDSREYAGGHAGGVPLDAVSARVDRFLVGTRRSGDVDLGHLFESIGELPPRPSLELDVAPLEAGVARCLANRPAVTRPPPPAALDRSIARATDF
jgi:signal peptidase I